MLLPPATPKRIVAARLESMISFHDAAAKVFEARGHLAGAAESETHWLFSPSTPDPQLGPTFVNRETGEIEQLDTDPKNWKPRLKEFRAQEPKPLPIPEEFFAHPRAMEQ